MNKHLGTSSQRAILIAIVSFLSAPIMLLAHHGLDTQFDTKKTIALTGSITRIDWSNPHVRLYLDVKDPDKTTNWELDMGSPNLQMMNGWKIDTYKRGDRVTVTAYPAKDGTNLAYGVRVSRR